MSVSVSGCVSVCTPGITCVRAYQPAEGREVGKGVKEEPGRSDAMLGDGACSQLVCVQYVCGVVFSILLVRVYVRQYLSLMLLMLGDGACSKCMCI